jgi:hypothetical protein
MPWEERLMNLSKQIQSSDSPKVRTPTVFGDVIKISWCWISKKVIFADVSKPLSYT